MQAREKAFDATTLAPVPTTVRKPKWTRKLYRYYTALLSECVEGFVCTLPTSEIASILDISACQVHRTLGKLGELGAVSKGGKFGVAGHQGKWGLILMLTNPRHLDVPSKVSGQAKTPEPQHPSSVDYDTLSGRAYTLLTKLRELSAVGTIRGSEQSLVEKLTLSGCGSPRSVRRALAELKGVGAYTVHRLDTTPPTKLHAFTLPAPVEVTIPQKPEITVSARISRFGTYTKEAAAAAREAESPRKSSFHKNAPKRVGRKPSLGPKYRVRGYHVEYGTAMRASARMMLAGCATTCREQFVRPDAVAHAAGSAYSLYGATAPHGQHSTIPEQTTSRGRRKKNAAVWMECNRYIDYKKEVVGSVDVQSGGKLSASPLVPTDDIMAASAETSRKSMGLLGVESVAVEAALAAEQRTTRKRLMDKLPAGFKEPQVSYVPLSQLLEKYDVGAVLKKHYTQGRTEMLETLARGFLLQQKLNSEYAPVDWSTEEPTAVLQWMRPEPSEEYRLASMYAQSLLAKYQQTMLAIPQPPMLPENPEASATDMRKAIKVFMLARAAVQEHFTGKRVFTSPKNNAYIEDIMRLYAKVPKLFERFRDVYRYVHWRMELYYKTNQSALLTQDEVPLKFIIPRRKPVDLLKGSVLVTHPSGGGQRITEGGVIRMPASNALRVALNYATIDAASMQYADRCGDRQLAYNAIVEHIDAVLPPNIREKLVKIAHQQALDLHATWVARLQAGEYIW